MLKLEGNTEYEGAREMHMRATFVMEQHLGHFSYYQNLRRFIDQVPEVEANWVEVNYLQPDSLWSRLPGFPKKLSGALAGRSQVLRGLRHKAYDVALFNTQVPAALGGKRILQKPYVICTDITPAQYDRMGMYYGHLPDSKTPLSAYKHKVNQEILRGAARVLPWSNWTGSSLIDDYGVDPSRVEVVPPGVDIDLWKPGDRTAINHLRILFVGGDLFRKGGDVLIEAFRRLPAGLAELVLVTHSPAPDEQGITTFQNIQPNSPELIALYQSSDIFALPTRAEAFGIATVEASAAGLPVIASAVGGLTDIVLDGKTGFIVQPGDAQSLADRLQLLAENVDLRRRMGDTGRQHVDDCFNARKNAQRVIKILMETILRQEW